jgi:transcriptional regulator with XRE-family HTH domain
MAKKGFFAKKLKELRLERGLTQTALAKMAGMSLPGYRQLEYGRRDPSYDTLRRLGQALCLSPGVLFPDEPTPLPRRKKGGK